MVYSSSINQHPTPCEAESTDDTFVSFLATVYSQLVKLTPPCKGQITRFHAIKPPDISIKDYLERIRRYFGCSNECFVLSLVYIDRIVKVHEDFSVSILNVHRLLITSIMLAAKFFDDVYYSNAFYARVGGVRTREINILEAHFLSLLDFHLFVSPEEYEQYRKNVLAAVNNQQLQRQLRNSQIASSHDSVSGIPHQLNQCDVPQVPTQFQHCIPPRQQSGMQMSNHCGGHHNNYVATASGNQVRWNGIPQQTQQQSVPPCYSGGVPQQSRSSGNGAVDGSSVANTSNVEVVSVPLQIQAPMSGTLRQQMMQLDNKAGVQLAAYYDATPTSEYMSAPPAGGLQYMHPAVQQSVCGVAGRSINLHHSQQQRIGSGDEIAEIQFCSVDTSSVKAPASGAPGCHTMHTDPLITVSW